MERKLSSDKLRSSGNGNTKWIVSTILVAAIAIIGWGKDLVSTVRDGDREVLDLKNSTVEGKANDNTESIKALWRSSGNHGDRLNALEVATAAAQSEREAMKQALLRLEGQAGKTGDKLDRALEAIYRIEEKLED